MDKRETQYDCTGRLSAEDELMMAGATLDLRRALKPESVSSLLLATRNDEWNNQRYPKSKINGTICEWIIQKSLIRHGMQDGFLFFFGMASVWDLLCLVHVFWLFWSFSTELLISFLSHLLQAKRRSSSAPKEEHFLTEQNFKKLAMPKPFAL